MSIKYGENVIEFPNQEGQEPAITEYKDVWDIFVKEFYEVFSLPRLDVNQKVELCQDLLKNVVVDLNSKRALISESSLRLRVVDEVKNGLLDLIAEFNTMHDFVGYQLFNIEFYDLCNRLEAALEVSSASEDDLILRYIKKIKDLSLLYGIADAYILEKFKEKRNGFAHHRSYSSIIKELRKKTS